ncbi:MAG: gamma-glutamyl-gamma-aminobutyrate hydrolase PuuD [Gammaproteobacteria bacterium]|jgi:gamma-glutamyl-gamma-aminobutyrate hydrolase PuuD
MKSIGISQRMDPIEGRNEARDALDVEWPRLLWDLGYLPVTLSSAIEATDRYLAELKLDGYILSGGGDIGTALSRDRLETAVLEDSIRRQVPVLGVCRGMQFINHYQGGSLKSVNGHIATRHPLQGAWSTELGIDTVNSFHGLGLMAETLGRDLETLAAAKDGVIEALRHEQHSWLGIMWHPEREQPFQVTDTQLIKSLFGD